MTRVFISYVRENRRQVDGICSFLRENGVDPWLDRESIRPGTPWRDAIRAAIGAGEYFVACFSTEYNSRLSSYMNEELNVAIGELRQRDLADPWFVPVLLSGNVPDWEIRPGRTLRDLQWIDFQLHGRERGLKMLLGALEPGKQQPESGAGASSDQVLVSGPAALEIVEDSSSRPPKGQPPRKQARKAQVEIRRPRELFGKDATYQVLVDNEFRGLLKPGGTAKVKLPVGKHSIHLYYYKPFSGSSEMKALLDHPRFGSAGKDTRKTSNTIKREFKHGEHAVLLCTTGFWGIKLKEI